MAPMASKTDVGARAPIRRRCALGLEKACSMGVGSGAYGGRESNRPCAFRAAPASLVRWGARVSRREAPNGRQGCATGPSNRRRRSE